MNNLVSKNRLYNLVCWGAFLLLSTIIEIQVIWWVVFGIFVLLVSFQFVISVDQQISIKASKKLEVECDPNSYLQTMDSLLKRKNLKSVLQAVLINKAIALQCLGRFDEALAILSDVNIDKYNGTLPMNKILYYNNLVDVLIKKEDYYQANIWFSKLSQMIADTKAKGKQKKDLQDLLAFNQAELALADNDFVKAEQLINCLSESLSNRQRVEKCLLSAKLLMKQNKSDEAKQYLQFVIDNGNKLYDVVQAHEMLNTL